MRDAARFLIAGTQRTGTTLLRTSLSSHSEVCCHGEVFKLGKAPYTLPGGYWAFSRSDVRARLLSLMAPRRLCSDYLRWLYGDTDHLAVGFKLMLDQCEKRHYLWPMVTSYPIRCIHVTRRNVLKTLLSRRSAARSGVYHVSATLPAKAAVSQWVAKALFIDADSVVAELDTISSEVERWKSRLATVPTLDIEYESYVNNQAEWNAKVQDFLDVPVRALHSDLKKVNPDRLTELIANYDEVAGVIGRSRYASCLVEEN